MKAITLKSFGDPSVLELRDLAPPPLRPGQLRIRVHASGVNRADIEQRRGHYPPPPGESEILGLEVAGEVIELGKDSRRFSVGARVMALLAGGGYAEQVVVDEHLVLPLPASLSYEQGAAIPEVFLTAHHNLFNLGGAKSGSRCLIHGGGGGVGTAGITLLRKAGAASVFVTVGSPEQADACRKLGAYSIEYHTQSFLEVIQRETKGQGVNVILDPVGASNLADNIKCLVMDGRLVLIGLMGGGEASLDMRLVLSRRLQVIGSTLRALPLPRKTEVVGRFRDQFLAALEAGEIAPILGRVFPASEVEEAHRWMESSRNIGKIVLSWS